MPVSSAVTPNRNYPYPLPTDVADVPGALEELAVAVENDVQFQYDRVAQRSVAKAWRTSSQSVISNWSSGSAFFLLLDDGFQINVNADFTVNGSRLYPTQPGFYLFLTTVSFPVVSLTTPYPEVRRTELFANGTVLLASSSLTNDLQVVDGSVEAVASGGRFMNGTTDYVQVAARIYSDNGAIIPTVRINTRSITGIRMNPN